MIAIKKNILFLLAAIIPIINHAARSESGSSSPVIISNPAKHAKGHYATKDQDGNIVLSWLEEEDKSTSLLFSISRDGGQSFSPALEIPAAKGCTDGHGEAPPKVAFKTDGTMIAVYTRKKPTDENPFAGTVEYSLSSDKGITWSPSALVHSDKSKNTGHSFHDIAILSDGEIGLIWLDGRDTSENGSALYFSKTTKGKGFGPDKKIAGPACQCCRTRLYSDESGKVYALFRSLQKDNCRDISLISSSDRGNTFSNPVKISDDKWMINGCPHTGPDISSDGKTLHFTWFTGGGKPGIYSATSNDKGKSFSERTLLSEAGRHPQITSMKEGDTILYCWDESIKEDKKTYTGIQLQISEENDKKQIQVSEKDRDAHHPLLVPITNKTVLITWLSSDGGKQHLEYKTITLP